MKNVLLITDRLEHYRIPLFNLLCADIKLTVAHNSKCTNSAKFNQHSIQLSKFGPFTDYKNLPDLGKFDVVIFPFNIRCLKLWTNLFQKRAFKQVVFGIGVSASYGKLYDQNSVLDPLRKFILRRSAAAIFYEQYPYIKYSADGIDSNKMSVAYNTVAPNRDFNINKKEFKSFIFIGSLYKQKRIFDLLEAYYAAFVESKMTIQPLEIVGDGEECDNIKKWIIERELEHKVIMHGHIDDDAQLLPIFNRAIACISPGQAGLSVQKCFSYGVPFITSQNPITGGELFSIINGVNGFVYDSSIKELSNIFLSLITTRERNLALSNNAYLFYTNFRNVQIWKEGFLKNIV